jgi:hypothetical protein
MYFMAYNAYDNDQQRKDGQQGQQGNREDENKTGGPSTQGNR